ncbi:MAG: AarF/ABC1/UbiB kinase family protein, partial [Chloroflexi bacterium]
LWLLGKTLGMMEGVGLKLDPDFDIFAVSEPYVRRLMRQVWLPDRWGPSLLRGITDWAELTSLAPRQAVRLLEQAERGELQIRLRLQELEETTARMDRMASRLALSILVAAFIVALALLIPALNLNAQWGIITWLVILGFVVASFLGLWLLITIWRAGRWR